jgi:hypothetical protein
MEEGEEAPGEGEGEEKDLAAMVEAHRRAIESTAAFTFSFN